MEKAFTVQNLLLISCTFVCLLTDLKFGKIFNKITYPAIIVGSGVCCINSLNGLKVSMIGIIGALAIYGLLGILGSIGMGDVKLMAAVGAIKGLSFIIFSSFYILCFGALIGLAALIYKKRLASGLIWLGSNILSIFVPGYERTALVKDCTTIPFCPAIFLGTTLTIILEYIPQY